MTTYLVTIPAWDGEHYSKVEAYDAESAAQQYAEERDDEHSLANGNEWALVKESEESVPQVFCVSAEARLDYSANEIEKLLCKRCACDLMPRLREGEGPYDDKYCSYRCYMEDHDSYLREHKLGKYREVKV